MNENNIKIVPKLIYFISFYSSLRNAHVHIFGDPYATVPVVLDYLFLALIMVTLTFIVVEKISNNKLYTINKYVWIFIFLIGWIVLQSLFNSVYMSLNMIPRTLITSLLTSIVILTGIETKQDFINALWAFIGGASISAIIPLIKLPEAIGLRWTSYQGIDYIGGIWNSVLISFLSTGWLIVSLIQKQEVNRKMKIIGAFSFGLIWFGAFAGLSRSFFLATLLSVLIYALSTKNMKKTVFFIFSFLIFLIFVESLYPDLFSGITTRLQNTITNLSEETRLVLWRGYLDNFQEYFLTGTIGDYLRFSPTQETFGPHSVFLNWIVRYGLVGLIGFLILLLRSLKEVLSIRTKAPGEYSALLAWISAYLVQITISETGFVETSFYTGLAFILLWSKFVNPRKVNNKQFKHQ